MLKAKFPMKCGLDIYARIQDFNFMFRLVILYSLIIFLRKMAIQKILYYNYYKNLILNPDPGCGVNMIFSQTNLNIHSKDSYVCIK